MKTYEEILPSEYSTEFDEIRKKAMVMSFYKYGMVKENYPHNVDAIKTLEQRLELFKKTGNLEYLCDVANQAMIEYMCPRHQKAHFKYTDSDKSPGLCGMSTKEIERFKELGE